MNNSQPLFSEKLSKYLDEHYDELRAECRRRLRGLPGITSPTSVLNEALEKVAQSIRNEMGIEPSAAFIMTKVTWIVKDRRRAQVARERHVKPGMPEGLEPAAPEDESARMEDSELLEQCLSELYETSPLQAEAFVLKRDGNKTMKEIALALSLRDDREAERLDRAGRTKLAACIAIRRAKGGSRT
jgi:DNA-directed RNA polymerase specialized sigma24 family protein